MNYTKLAVLFVFILSNVVAWAHGSIEIIECHNNDNTLVLNGQALNKQNDFSFKLKKNNKEMWTSAKKTLKLKDTVENKQLIENILVSDKKFSIEIKIFEIPSREIRNGSGSLKIPHLKINQQMTCYAVY